MGWKSKSKVHFSKQMFLSHLFLPFILRYVKIVIAIIFHIYFQFFIFECYNVLINLVLEIIKHTERKKKWSKCYLTTSNILKKLVWLLSFWIEYGNNCQLLFFPESKFNAYLCNLRWHHNRFQTLRRCYRGIFNFRHWKFGKLMSWVLLTSMPIFRLVEFVELQN